MESDQPSPEPALGRWCYAAALASTALVGVFWQAAGVARWEMDHPVYDPADTSPGGGTMGDAIVLPFLLLGAAACAVLALGWLIIALARRRSWSAGLADLTLGLVGCASLLALLVSLTLPWGRLDALGGVAAFAVGLRARLLLRRLHPAPPGIGAARAAQARAAAEAQNQA